jgi:murein DD-endopeptidase MepM/ murein hydrolase activator NlpD
MPALSTVAGGETIERLRAEEQRLAAERAAAVVAAQALEAQETAARTRAAAAAAQVEALGATLTRQQEALAVLAGPLALASQSPLRTLLGAPIPPDEATGGLALMGAIGREVLARMAATARAERQAERERAEAAAASASLAAAQARQRRTQVELTDALSRAREQRFAAVAAAAAAARAANLRAAVARLEAARAAAEAAAAHTQAAGTAAGPVGRLAAPVGGALASGWHHGTDGVTFAATPGARVLAPCSGQVEFADPFRSYGHLVIVDCGGGWRTVLGGMERLLIRTGERVRAGTPVGTMPTDGRQGLYLELRQGARAVDPLPYLRHGG